MTNPKPENRRFIEVTPSAADRMRSQLTETPQIQPESYAPDKIDLGPLSDLLGVWTAKGTGWNMIALPFADAPSPPNGFGYRVLMNQYDEELVFSFVDEGVPNRGLKRPEYPGPDQVVSTIDYQQKISQIASADKPESAFAGGPNDPIHHEPGLWLYMRDLQSADDEGKINLARLAAVPHGNSVMALGHYSEHDGMPDIQPLNALPIGRFEDLATPTYDFTDPDADPYLYPYRHFIENPFMGVEADPFPGFSPADMNAILNHANDGLNITHTTALTVDTRRMAGGVRNAPFVTREAEPVSMRSTFWIQTVQPGDKKKPPYLRMQYSQVVMLEFFTPRQDQLPGRALWPHVSIATLEKMPADYEMVRDEPSRKM